MAFKDRLEIKNRIVKNIASEWGLRPDVDTDRFDPLVNLLLEACAYEFERAYHENSDSGMRTFDRLVEVLAPSAKIAAQPAHAIMRAIPLEGQDFTNIHDLYYTEHGDDKRKIFFSSVGNFNIFNGDIAYIACKNCITPINKKLESEQAIYVEHGAFPSSSIYLGIRLHNTIESIEGLSFFFNDDILRRQSLLSLLGVAHWSVNNQEITVSKGRNSESTTALNTNIFSTLHHKEQSERMIHELYERHFFHIHQANISVEESKRTYPVEFEDFFSEQALKQIREPLLWIRISLPEDIKLDPNSLECYMNCFPVMNRELKEINDTLDEQITNIVSLPTENRHFFAIDNLTNSEDQAYQATPLQYINSNKGGLYAIRRGGVQRFDQRDASQMLNYIIDLIKDERASFNALSYQGMDSDLSALDIRLRKIRENITDARLDDATFLFIQPYDNDKHYYCKYWLMDGEAANGIPKKTSLKIYGAAKVIPNSIYLITASKGGKEQLNASERIHAFKESLMTRDRIVTPEDIRIFCTNYLGESHIEHIEIKKGVKKGEKSNQGFIRTIDTFITLKNNYSNKLDWKERCENATVLLNKKSTSIYPIQVIIANEW